MLMGICDYCLRMFVVPHAMSTVTDQDIDNNNCIQEYRQFQVDISVVCILINRYITHIRDSE